MEQHLLLGDSKDVLKTITDGSIDLLATDPPYGIEFMGKSWDKVLPDKEIWNECYRVLKPGSFIAVMSSPRSDVLYRMIKDLEDVGFDMSFSPILWTYHTGFPKASDTSKMLDKRGVDLDGKYDGSKLGFQPKPAVEHIIIGMKPHGSKSYIDNVLNFEALPENIKMTYPFLQVPKPAKKEKDMGILGSIELLTPTTKLVYLSKKDVWEKEDLKTQKPWEDMEALLQRDIDEYGVVKKDETKWNIGSFGNYIMEQYQKDMTSTIKTETNSTTLLTTLNSSIENSIRNYIVELFGERVKDINFVKNAEQKNTKVSITLQNKDGYSLSVKDVSLEGLWNIKIGPSKTTHPTTKPVKLMSYIITLFTREGDWILDPFLGSGTTGVASKLINRNFVGIEREQEYMDIAQERCGVDRDELIKFFKEGK